MPEFSLGWFGPEFVDGAQVLRILSIGYLISAAAGPCATALMMIGQEKAYSVVALLSVAFVIIASLVLIPRNRRRWGGGCNRGGHHGRQPGISRDPLTGFARTGPANAVRCSGLG